ncbi:9213_t:CDS:2 [Entrophospora sp. SA101]|nr:9213_t:CDS:2 [Entrophospora sp. SA101]
MDDPEEGYNSNSRGGASLFIIEKLELVRDLIPIQGKLDIDINPILEAELRRDKASSDKPIRLFDLLLCLEDDIATIQEKLGIVGYTNQEMGNY